MMPKTSYKLQIVREFESYEMAVAAARRAAKKDDNVALYEEKSTESGQTFERRAIWASGPKTEGIINR